VSGGIRRLYDFELEPEVRGRLDGLSDSDFERVDEVCGLLAERGTELGGPWSDHLEGPVWGSCGSGCAMCGQDHVLVYFSEVIVLLTVFRNQAA
jgi:hypothetical protein